MPTAEANITPRLQQRYKDEIAPALRGEFNYDNSMQIPAIKKIAINIGLGEAVENANAVEAASRDIAAITGQRPYVRRSKKAISNFKLREGMPIGVSVTLRGVRMWEFLDRLLNTALPRIRDFHGVSDEAFDGHGNYSLGLTEQVIFPELSFDDVDRVRGLQVNIVTSAETDAEAKRLLALLGMPFVKK